MAEPSETCVAWGLDGGVHEARNLKPMLTPEEQVELLKAKGVTFECCDERAAIEALTRKNTFMHLAACRRLFHKHREGPKKGKYIKLDFADLLRMDNLDTEIRHVFLLATQDAERLAKTAVIARASEDSNEDGYGIVADFMESQQTRYRGYIERDLSLRRGKKSESDVYSGQIIAHYSKAMPVWTFLEVVSFGTLLAFYLFCSNRWKDKMMKEEHYVLKGVKSVRNCCSHGSCILNGMDVSCESNYVLSSLVYDWLNKNGISNGKTRRAKLRNRRIQQLLETIVMLDRLGGVESPNATKSAMKKLHESLLNICRRYGDQYSFVTYLRFLAVLVDKVG